MKLFNSLKLRKYRKKYSLFLAEGNKIVFDLLKSSYHCSYLIVVSDLEMKNLNSFKGEILYVSQSEMKKISSMKTAPQIIGVFETNYTTIDFIELNSVLSFYTDDIQDPGNFGTIIRTADWFGIKHIICSEHTVDMYNPKVVQASMGALAGVKIMYTEPACFFPNLAEDIPVYGTFMKGDSIFESELSKKGIIILGNEGKGISDAVQKYITKKISIPPSFYSETYSESLNVSSAAAVVCSEFFRRKLI